MARATGNGRRRQTSLWAAALLVLGAYPAEAAQAKAKDRPWPTQDDAPATATGCEYMGKGYTKLPGSDTCVRISGSMRSEGAILDR